MRYTKQLITMANLLRSHGIEVVLENNTAYLPKLNLAFESGYTIYIYGPDNNVIARRRTYITAIDYILNYKTKGLNHQLKPNRYMYDLTTNDDGNQAYIESNYEPEKMYSELRKFKKENKFDHEKEHENEYANKFFTSIKENDPNAVIIIYNRPLDSIVMVD